MKVLDSEKKRFGFPEVLEELKGESMLGWFYDGPFDDFDAAQPAVEHHRVIAWDEVSESDGEASEGVGREHITPVPDTELHGSGRHPDLSTVFVKGPGGTLRLLLGMVAANRPLRLARGMKWAVASAGAAGAYGVFFGSIWSLSN